MTEPQISILSRSPKFCISQPGNYFDIKKDIATLQKKLKLAHNFKDSDYVDPSLVKHSTITEVKTNNEWLQYIVNVLDGLEPEPIQSASNVSREERNAIRELRENKNIVIKKADKTNVFVIMDTTYYRDKLVLQDHLNTSVYERTTEDADKKVFNAQTKLMDKHVKCLTKKEYKYITNYMWKTSNFYVNPKISKCKEIKERMRTNNRRYLKMQPPSTLKGRPIISGPISPTKHLSQLISKILAPLVPLQDSYIKDDWAFIKQLPRNLDYEAELFTCDVVSLYTSIPHDLGVEAIEFWLQEHRDKIPRRFTRDFIIDSILFILQNNNFYFDGHHYHQLEGTGMGVDFAGNYACLVMGYLEKVKLFGELLTPHFTEEERAMILEAFLRYVDDGFIFWPASLDINIFIGILNQLHPNIKYTVERGSVTINGETIVFLDIRVTLHNRKRIETELFYKVTNNHHYLEYDSFHAKHVKDNIPYSFFKKILVFTSDSKKEAAEIERMKYWLYNSGYPKYIVDKGLHNAKLQGPAPNPADKKDIIPFVTQNSSNFSCSQVTKKLQLLIDQCPDQETRDFFKSKDIIQAVRQPPNILRQLTSAKFDSEKVLPDSPGTYKCNNSGCKICVLYMEECQSVTGSNGTTWQIQSRITCHSRLVIYYLTCLGCGKCTKVGKTNVLRDRTNNHISDSKSGATTDTFDKHVFKCKKNHKEPLFKLNVLMEVNHYDKLLVYEEFFHKQGFDTINRKNATAAR